MSAQTFFPFPGRSGNPVVGDIVPIQKENTTNDTIVSFYFFEDQAKISATRTKEQLEEMKKDVAGKAIEISRSDFRPTPGKYCDFCEFRLICEAWQ